MYGNGFGSRYNYGNSDLFDFGTSSNFDGHVLASILSIYFLILGIMCVCLIVGYLLRAIGQYNMAKYRSIKYPWLAFIPVANNYQLGMLTGNVKLGKHMLKNTKLWLLLLPIIFSVIFGFLYAIIIVMAILANANAIMFAPMMITLVLFILVIMAGGIFINILFALAYFKLFSFYKDRDVSLLYTLLSLFVPLANAIIIFTLRTKQPVNLRMIPAGMPQQAPQRPAAPPFHPTMEMPPKQSNEPQPPTQNSTTPNDEQ